MNLDFSKIETSLNILPNNDFEEKVQQFIHDWRSNLTTVTVQTSGSTGTPKILEIEKQRMLHSARKTCDFLNLKPGDTALLCLPVEYISGKMMLVRAFVRQLTIDIVPPSLSPLSQVDHEIDFCAMTPLQVEHSLSQLHWIKNLIIGGAAVSEDLKRKIHNALKDYPTTKIYETYGMSETLSHIGLKKIHPVQENYFQLLEGIEISTDNRNCLKISAPELNPETLQTNDIVEIINKKQFRFVGRADHIINSGGVKISPEELEHLAKKEIAEEIVFLGIPDAELGQKLIAVIELQNLDRKEHLIDIIQHLEFKNKHHRPKEIIFIPNIPRTPNGKVSRLALMKELQNNKI
ncbi:AMP-binding protein [Elizabethkingia sp. JS20170427COW]|uniref:AMP-binding protein n=1 Tax=Elizabethkingia sp. JS20170427COW TaxID=2583851 RepID=UPI0011108837|nr:AMP-binding protein [Elizabethkingia sp. JS20170427COW]QCX52512.1 AMP-binding protein [Elizabethkingia sp. JS20170427COW]